MHEKLNDIMTSLHPQSRGSRVEVNLVHKLSNML
jgi:hypothetical protein